MPSLPRPSELRRLPPIWREGRSALELATLLRDPVFREVDPRAGADRPVLLIPGFLAGDGSLGVMTGWLRRAGYRTCRTGMRLNVGCSAAALDAVEERLERFVERRGAPAAIVGQSRGGTLARALAVRRPDLISTVIALGSPQLDPFAIHPLVLAQIGVLGALGTLGAPGLFRESCWRGDCCREFRASFDRPFPDGVGYVSVYSRSDGIVDWRACLDPAAVHVEVDASHIGMAVNAQAFRAVADALERAGAGALGLAA
jgi:pimeloyl-ACP methyl ester carboxylesterase